MYSYILLHCNFIIVATRQVTFPQSLHLRHRARTHSWFYMNQIGLLCSILPRKRKLQSIHNSVMTWNRRREAVTPYLHPYTGFMMCSLQILQMIVLICKALYDLEEVELGWRLTSSGTLSLSVVPQCRRKTFGEFFTVHSLQLKMVMF